MLTLEIIFFALLGALIFHLHSDDDFYDTKAFFKHIGVGVLSAYIVFAFMLPVGLTDPQVYVSVAVAAFLGDLMFDELVAKVKDIYK